MAYYCPHCEPGFAGGNGYSIAYCRDHAGPPACTDCGALSGDKHFLHCRQRPPLPALPPAGIEISAYIRRRAAERRRRP